MKHFFNVILVSVSLLGLQNARAQSSTMDAQALTQAALDRVPGADLTNTSRSLTDRTEANVLRSRGPVFNTVVPAPFSPSGAPEAKTREIRRLQDKRRRSQNEYAKNQRELEKAAANQNRSLLNAAAYSPLDHPSSTPVKEKATDAELKKKGAAKFDDSDDGKKLKLLLHAHPLEGPLIAPRP